MKIIAGKHRGRKLESPRNKDVRPTVAKARESLFNLLMHMHPNPVVDCRIADLFCGTGALGLEALSRGAEHVTFIDQNRDSIHLAEDNAELLNESENCKFLHSSSIDLPSASEPYDLVMMDPPYNSGLAKIAYAALREKGWVITGSIVAFEQSHKEGVPELEGCEIIKDRVYGKSRIVVGSVT